MKIPDHFIEELIQEVAGERGTKLVFLIKDKKNVSEFKIAEKLGITVNEVRNVLYKLQDVNVVSFTRKKDKKKGWYIYYWTFDLPKARDLILDVKIQKQQSFKDMLKNERQGNVYVCPSKCIRVNAETALEHSFKCPECDTVLTEENVQKRLEKIKKDLIQLKLDIEEVSKIEKPKPKPESLKKKIIKKPAKKIPRKPKKKQIKKRVARKRKMKTPKKKSKKKPPSRRKPIPRRKSKPRHKKPKRVLKKPKRRLLRRIKRRFRR
jgi:transcription factor E